jgi:K+-sensing histidine kinase KdpD
MMAKYLAISFAIENVVRAPHPHTAALIRRARRVADYLQADCVGVAVRSRGDSKEGDANLEKQLNFARNLHITVEVFHAGNVAQAVVDFARAKNATQIYFEPRSAAVDIVMESYDPATDRPSGA